MAYNAFLCRSVTYDEKNQLCMLSGADVKSTSASILKPKIGFTFAQRAKCVDCMKF